MSSRKIKFNLFMKNILVASKNIELINKVVKVLSHYEFNTTTTDHISTTTKLLRNKVIDIIITSYDNYDNTGYSIISYFKLRTNNIKLPIFIFVGKNVSQKEIRKGMELGADDFITFPFTDKELIASINTQINKRRSIENHISEKLSNKFSGHQDGTILNQFKGDLHDVQSKYIFLDDKNHAGFYLIKDIAFVTSFGDYTKVCIAGKKNIVIHKTLSSWEKFLPKSKFLRIHRQTIINLDYVDKVEKTNGAGYNLYLKNISTNFTISQRYSKKIKHTWGVNSL